ncbi:hypothetical protein J4Q44_G00063040 [Coregonus suidteri]|uniref:Uncharacterized protein n=1 Tax=Coregonus suidteri TaxID=861788 RepID=A0AAN8MHF9_9TELE
MEPRQLGKFHLTRNSAAFTLHLHLRHLADALIQSDLQLVNTFINLFIFLLAPRGNQTHNPGVANAMLYQLSYIPAGHFPPLPWTTLGQLCAAHERWPSSLPPWGQACIHQKDSPKWLVPQRGHCLPPWTIQLRS